MNIEIIDGMITIPEERILGRITRDMKKIDSIENLRTKAKKDLYDSYGNKTFMIMNKTQINEIIDEISNVLLYDVQRPENLENDEILIIINDLKPTATVNMIAKAKEFHQQSIDRLTEFLA